MRVYDASPFVAARGSRAYAAEESRMTATTRQFRALERARACDEKSATQRSGRETCAESSRLLHRPRVYDAAARRYRWVDIGE